MQFVKNLLDVPFGGDASMERFAESSDEVDAFSGKVSNGHSRVYASFENTGRMTAKIDFLIRVNSVEISTFNAWLSYLSETFEEGILPVISAVKARLIRTAGELAGPEGIQKVEEEFQGGPQVVLEKMEKFMSLFSLVVFKLAFGKGLEVDDLWDKSNIPFSSEKSRDKRCTEIVESISRLPSSVRTFSGTLEANANTRVSEAFIPVTYFHFLDGRVVSFAGYRGPIVLPGSDMPFTALDILNSSADGESV